MKRFIRNSSDIFCMAIINPSYNKQLSIQVEIEQRDEGPIPHLYVFLDKTRNKQKCAYIRLDRAEYLEGHNSAKLTGKSLSEFISIMKAIWSKYYIQSEKTGEIRQATGYEAAVVIWKDTFGETIKFSYDSDGFPIMPDYNNLNK